jgi:hypothetical protein
METTHGNTHFGVLVARIASPSGSYLGILDANNVAPPATNDEKE